MIGEEIRRRRQERGWTGVQLAEKAGMAPSAVSQIETGKRGPHSSSVIKLAAALECEVAELYPKAPQAPLPLEPSFENELTGERLAGWGAAVEEARQLQETAGGDMWRLLSEWRASKGRGEDSDARREHRLEIGSVLTEVFTASEALGWAYLQAAAAEGDSYASTPSYLRKESRRMDDFYFDLVTMVMSAGLSVHRRAGETTDKAAAPEKRPHIVEESDAA